MVWIGVPILLLVEGVEGGDELCSPILPVVDPADELCSVAPPEVSGLPDGDEVSAANTGVRPIANAATINARGDGSCYFSAVNRAQRFGSELERSHLVMTGH